MQVLAGLVLGFVAAAIVVSRTQACSDVKVFLAPCTVKASGTSITKERALDIQSEFVKREGLMAIANEAVEYFDFDLAVFEGICEVSITGACRVFDCGCDQGADVTESSKSGARVNCYMYPDQPICDIDTVAPKPNSAPIPTGPTGETIVAFCFGNSCKGFSFFSKGIAGDRVSLCSESTEAINSCRSDNDSPDVTPEEPTCDAELLTNCCNTPKLVCLCATCSSRIWLRTTSSGKLAFKGAKYINRGSDDVCIC